MENNYTSDNGFNHAYKKHANMVRAVVFSYEKDPTRVEELVQDVFLRAWERRATFRHQSNIGTWLYTIARSVAVNHVRDEVERKPKLVVESDCGEGGEEDESFLDAVLVDYLSPEKLVSGEDTVLDSLNSLTYKEKRAWEVLERAEAGDIAAGVVLNLNKSRNSTFRGLVANMKKKLI